MESSSSRESFSTQDDVPDVPTRLEIRTAIFVNFLSKKLDNHISRARYEDKAVACHSKVGPLVGPSHNIRYCPIAGVYDLVFIQS